MSAPGGRSPADTLAAVPSSSDSTSLYRRHRPRSFKEVVGQQHVVRTLRNAVAEEKVHHAYLFVGSRGTGKTSLAKILASTLNCERRGDDMEACGECESCRTIAAGTSVDVIEMDAASNRSVDDVRDLRERVAYAPVGGHWKVYILDEAHMLTKEAWNAFLKTLEEPPPNTVFVLATTEAHKVMATIADRCQRFDFQRPSLEQISEVVERVADAEGIEIEPGATAMIARSASGSFRDALGTLDQLVAFGGEKVRLDAVMELLGAADAELLFEAVDGVIAEDPKAVLLGVERMARSGRDPAQFVRDLLAHLRHLLVIQTIGEIPETFVITASDEARLSAQAGGIGAATLVRTIDELAGALTAVREGDEARMAVEIALLKAARPDLDPSSEGLLRRVERLEKNILDSGGDRPRVLSPDEGGAAGEGVLDPPHPTPPAADAGIEDGSDADAPAEDDPVEGAEAQETQAAEGRAAEGTEAGGDDDGPAASETEDAGSSPPCGAVDGPADPSASDSVGSAVGGADSGGSRTETVSPPADPPEAGSGPAADPASSPVELDELIRLWPAVIDSLRQNAPALAATFEGARPVGLDEDGVTIGFPASLTFNKRKAEAPDKREQMTEAIEATVGSRLRPVYVLLEAEDAPGGEPAEPEVDHEALVEKMKSEFNAEEVG
jgi:DNA polymerase III subunit gamma/tau